MTSKELSQKQLTPIDIEVDEMGETITITMPLAPMDCQSESGKMDILCTSNGWLKTGISCPRSAKPITVQIFVGTKA